MKNILSIVLAAMLCCLWTTNLTAQTLKIGENGTYTTNSPVWGNKANNYVMSQIIYSASELTALEGQKITALTFYTRSSYASNVKWSNMEVRITERESATFASISDWEDVSGVTPQFTGSLDATGSSMVIELTTAYEYKGGNLIIDIRNSAKTSASSSGKPRFQATSASNTVLYDYNSSSSTPTTYTERDGKRPDVLFAYEEAATGGCANPKNLTISDEVFDGAKFAWEQGGDETTYQWACVAKDADVESWNDLDADVRSVTVDGLTPGTSYDFWVRSYCGAGEGEQSTGVKKNFTPNYTKPAGVAVASITDVTAAASWGAVADADGYKFVLSAQGEEANWENVATVTENSAALTALKANTKYALHVAAVYGSHLEEAAAVNFQTASYAPQSLKFVSATTTTASFQWEKNENCSSDKFQWSTDGTNWSASSTDKTATVTGLTSGTTYTFYVRSAYDNGSFSEAASVKFTTECEVASMPFEESFAGGELPACWSATSQWTYYGYETFSMRYTSSANGDLTLPAIALDDDAQLTFWRQSNYVSCSVYANSVSEENKLAEFAKTGEKWAESVVDLSAYKGQTVTLIIRGNYYSGSKYLYFDDVAVTYKPVDAPAALAAEAADGGASITWAAAEGVTWNLQYRAQGDESWKEVSGLTTNTYALEGLVNGVTYEVRVQAVASANRKSDWTAPVAFTPENCPSVTEITYGAKTYNSIVINWTTSGAGTWDLRYQQGELGWNSPITNLSEASYTLTALTAGIPYSVQVKPSCGNDNTWVDGEAFTLGYTKPADVAVSDITDAQATATWAAVADAPNGYMYAVVLKGATVNWNEARATNDLSVSLIGLEALTDYDLHVAAVYGDHLEAAAAVNFTTVAIAPKNLAQEGESTTSAATFTWEANGAAEKWQWSIDGENWSEPISELTATADELNAGTAYTFYVRSYYAEGKFSSAISLDFSTECAVVTLPFAQDFSTVDGTKPTCWTIANWGTSANSWYTYTDYAKTGYALRYNARTLSSADAVTPSIEITDAAELKFYIKNSVGNNSAKVECKVLVNDGTETTELADITTRYTAATLQTIDLSAFAGKTVTIIFRGVGYDTSGSPYLWIDDVTVTFKAVAVPTSLHTAATDGGATVVWGSEEGTSWNLRYREVAEQEGDWTLVEGLTEKSTELTGLTNGTTYEVQVQAVASANRKSEWTESVEFAPVACAAVTEVTFGAATYNSVVVNWTTTGIGLWDVRYKASDGEWTEVKNIEELTTTLTDLTTNAVYSVEVKAACSDDAWVAAEAFTPVYTKPANVAVSDITDIIATATWDAVADAPNGYKYIVVLKDATVDWNDAKATDELDVPLIGLNALTAYDLNVATVYGDHLEAAAAVSFTTIAFAPTNLAQVGESTTSAATFAWEAQGAATQWQWSLDGENWSEPISVLTATADELNAGTAYTFYVRSYYDNEAVSEAISLAFTTECAVVALPFAEDFEAEGQPVCWETESWSESSSAGKWNRDNSYYHSGYALRFNAKTNASATITTPAIRLGDEDAVQLTFFIRNSYGSTPNYISGKVTVVDIDDADNKVEAEFINAKADNLEEQTVDLAALLGKIVTVTFTANGVGTSTNASLYIDDVKVDVKPIVPAAIDNIVAVDKARKLIENDQVVIIRNGVKYNAQGVVVK